ncbi:MAG: hypothetical protein RBT33_04135, partial [Candidatus Dojkabacteria bacterium]|nr:hypothetical protein [Candidatus Dojkabacteria bacterium]
ISVQEYNSDQSYAFTKTCPRGDGCSPAYNTRYCRWQRQNLCSSTVTSKQYLKAGESATITSTANTSVNTFSYVFYNRDNGNAVVCSNSYIAGWATTQGACAAGKYQLMRSNTYATARTSESTTFPASNIFISDANWGGQTVKRLQVNGYFNITNKPWSYPEAPCVFTEDYCSPLCVPQSCVNPYQTNPTAFGRKVYSCPNSPAGCGTQSNLCYCSYQCEYIVACDPTLSNSNLGFGTSTVTTTCSNSCGSVTPLPCYCKDCNLPIPNGTTLSNTGRQSTDPAYQTTSCSKGLGCTPKSQALYCTRCTPAACGPTFSDNPIVVGGVNQGSVAFGCNNTLSSCGTESKACYCYSCTPPQCAPTYSTENSGYGSVNLSCTNGCSVQTSRTCYIDKCSNCALSNCPSPLTNTATTSNPNMSLADYRTCTRNVPCGGPPNAEACYEQVSRQPTATLEIVPDGVNKYGFSSSTHTGNRQGDYNLNDPLSLTATYTDIDGYTDIEAVSVWFRNSSQSGEVQSPLWIDTAVNPSQSPSAPSADSWGFMMRWEGSSWRPYVPSYPTTGTAKWVRAVSTGDSFVISGPRGLQMVRVTLGNISRTGNDVVLPFQLSFTFTEGFENVGQVTYNTYLMGNDIFSFTPYDNYGAQVSKIGDYWSPGQLRYRTSPTPAQLYARQWSPTGHNWTIDKENPSVTLSMTAIEDTTLKLSWSVQDTKQIYAIVGNIYASLSMPPEPQPISLSETGTVAGLDFAPEYTLSTDEADLGKLNTGYAFRKLSINAPSYSEDILIDIGGNKEGSLIVYLTVFDMAGNMHIQPLTYSLGDWISTNGGLAFSSEGMDFEVKEIASESAWDGVSVLSGMDPTFADISTELFADNQLSGTNPSGLTNSGKNNSYHIRPFAMNLDITSFYSELLKAYNDRLIEGKVDLSANVPAVTELNGNLRSIGSCNSESSVCILKHTGTLQVGNTSDFVCDGWGVFFVDGDLVINRRIINTNANRDACIFVVRGNVEIMQGAKASSTGQIQYDEINAYIITDGDINIEAETVGQKYDGVFIGGALQTLGGLNVNRSLKLVDRNIYPVLMVKYHSKYSVLSNLVFGSQVDILKTEIGFKPY